VVGVYLSFVEIWKRSTVMYVYITRNHCRWLMLLTILGLVTTSKMTGILFYDNSPL
jgi:hypothetical protein